MGKLRIGLIGTGRFGRLHLKVLQQISGAEVAAIADINRQALHSAAAECRVGPEDCYGDPLELIRRSDLDAVDIVSDEKSHGALVLSALRQGKHVIVEKPLSVSFAEAQEIETTAALSGKQVMVGNISRFSQPYFTIKRAVDSGRLGRIAAIRSQRDFSRSWFQGFGNRIHPVYESGVHELDLMLWYAGCRCVRVSAFESHISGYKYPDLFSALLYFENGITASLDSSWLVPDGAPQNLVEALELGGTIDARIEVIGEDATARYQLAHQGLSIWTAAGLQYPETTLWPLGPEGIGGAIRGELEHFVQSISRKEASPVMPLSHSVHVIEIADAIVESARTQTVIHLGEKKEGAEHVHR
ncbi:Gfo/Idh/MocA family protein [Paenibacillus sp. S150]|uniref:Gfo/Idh/MocA family protein n=1 Tax=Paenibacillus sp. S150 TaxID=2749826 RepID=UPI001C568E11|nr:Gfo/Idh/MocA family oxidoreductase [Paenibacillus sp. S150]MBW4084261.1 Gfo/Idh/MocA family oxidoreductase [Paenibacillus sp. S150]